MFMNDQKLVIVDMCVSTNVYEIDLFIGSNHSDWWKLYKDSCYQNKITMIGWYFIKIRVINTNIITRMYVIFWLVWTSKWELYSIYVYTHKDRECINVSYNFSESRLAWYIANTTAFYRTLIRFCVIDHSRWTTWA